MTSECSAGIEPIFGKNYVRRSVIMGTYFIKREEIKVDVTRLDRKTKNKYRFTAKAKAPIYFEPEVDGEWQMRATTNMEKGEFASDLVYSKTKHGAEVTAVTNLLQKCRPPLSKAQKIKNKSLKKEGKEEIKRRVGTEVRVSNALDFIMGGNNSWHEIKGEPK